MHFGRKALFADQAVAGIDKVAEAFTEILEHAVYANTADFYCQVGRLTAYF